MSNDRLTEKLQSHGATVFSFPTIAIHSLPFHVKQYSADWVVFTSKNAVEPFFSNYTRKIKIAAIGQGTAGYILKAGHKPDFTGIGNNALSFANELKQNIPHGSKLLLALGNLAPDTLENELSDYRVERINVYCTELPEEVDNHILQMIKNDLYDLIIAGSPSAVNNLVKILQNSCCNLRLACIGETTAAAARNIQLEPVLIAPKQSYEELADLIITH